MGYSAAEKNAALDDRSADFAFASLHSADPGDTGANEIAGGSPAYTRQAVTWNLAAAGEATISNQPIFDVPSGANPTYIGYWSALTGGIFRGQGVLSPAPGVYTAQGLLKIYSGKRNFNAQGSAVPEIVGTLVLPVMQLAGTGLLVPLGIGSLVIPAPVLAASGARGVAGGGGLIIPPLALSGSGQYGEVYVDVQGNITLLAMVFSGSGLLVPVGSGNLVIPAPVLAGSGFIVVQGTGTLTLPALQISGSGGIPIPAPTGHSVVAGNLEIVLHPGSAGGADSYNAYFTTDGSTPSKMNGTHIVGVTDGQHHTGLTALLQYKYVFVAVDGGVEGDESTVVSAYPYFQEDFAGASYNSDYLADASVGGGTGSILSGAWHIDANAAGRGSILYWKANIDTTKKIKWTVRAKSTIGSFSGQQMLLVRMFENANPVTLPANSETNQRINIKGQTTGGGKFIFEYLDPSVVFHFFNNTGSWQTGGAATAHSWSSGATYWQYGLETDGTGNWRVFAADGDGTNVLNSAWVAFSDVYESPSNPYVLSFGDSVAYNSGDIGGTYDIDWIKAEVPA